MISRRIKNRRKVLRYCTEMELRPVPPFHFQGTVFKPSHFPSSDLAFDGSAYWQSIRFRGDTLGLRMVSSGTPKRPQVTLAVFSSRRLPRSLLDALGAEISSRFDLRADLKDFELECRSDPILGPVLQRWSGMRVSSGVSLYEFLVIATVLQNATVRRSVQMLQALFDRFGLILQFDGQELSAFWEPEEIHRTEEDKLRALKLGYRAKTLKRQAECFYCGKLDEGRLRQMSSPELRKELLQVYGIGPASVWYLMFEVFKRYDSFEYVSPWEQRIFARLLFDADEVDVDVIRSEVTRRWGRWRMLAVHYLFEDLFWRHRSEPISWLEALIRL